MAGVTERLMAGQLPTTRMDQPTDARQVKSRKALTAALLALLEERPFDQLTIREIASRAGIGYATFFRHYPTKEALLSDVASEEIAALLAKSVPILLDVDSFEASLALCNYVAEDRKLWIALLTGGAAGIVRKEFIELARELARNIPRRSDWLPADLGVTHGTGAVIDILAWWLAHEDEISPPQVAVILDRLVINPLVRSNDEPLRHADKR